MEDAALVAEEEALEELVGVGLHLGEQPAGGLTGEGGKEEVVGKEGGGRGRGRRGERTSRGG